MGRARDAYGKFKSGAKATKKAYGKAKKGAKKAHRAYGKARKMKRKLTKPVKPFRFHV